MSEMKWIKLSTEIFQNRKIKLLESLPNGEKIVLIWVKTLTLAGTINDNGLIYISPEIPYTETALAVEFNAKPAVVHKSLEMFRDWGMIETVNGFIRVKNWEKYQTTSAADKAKQKTKERVAAYRKRKSTEEKTEESADDVTPCNAECNADVTPCNGIDKDKDIDIEKEKEIYKEKVTVDTVTAANAADGTRESVTHICEDVIAYLNDKTGQHYRPDAKETQTLIRARLKTFTPEDLKTVIDKMTAYWSGTEMEQYLRPSTLFSPQKFESYLNGTYRGKYTPRGASGARQYNPDGTYTQNGQLYGATGQPIKSAEVPDWFKPITEDDVP